jgi:hypothetical protein
MSTFGPLLQAPTLRYVDNGGEDPSDFEDLETAAGRSLESMTPCRSEPQSRTPATSSRSFCRFTSATSSA